MDKRYYPKVLGQIFIPIYPGYIPSKSGATNRAFNHKIYADFPGEIVEFYGNNLKDIWNGQNINIKEKWNAFLTKHPEYVIYGKSICSFYLRSMPPSSNHQGKGALAFRVNRVAFERYLESKSSELMSQCISAGNLGPLRSFISSNFFRVSQFLVPSNPIELRKASRWRLKTTSDFGEIMSEIERLRILLNPIDVIFPTYQFFTDMQNLEYSVNRLMIQSSYLYLRNVQEKIIVSAAIIEISKKLSDMPGTIHDWVRIAHSVYTIYYTNLEKVNSHNDNLSSFKFGGKIDTFIDKFVRIITNKGLINANGEIDDNQMSMFLSDPKSCLPVIHFGKEIINSMENLVGDANGEMYKSYSMCSSYIHELLPFPFDSLLELKSFKRFFNFYDTVLEMFLNRLNTYVMPFFSLNDASALFTRSDQGVLAFWETNKKILLHLVKKCFRQLSKGNNFSSMFIRLSARELFSLYHIIRPGVSRFSKGQFNGLLFDNLVTGIQEYSYSPALYEGIHYAINYFSSLFEDSKNSFVGGKNINFNRENTIFLTYMLAEYSHDWPVP